MKKKIITILLAFTVVGAVSTLVLYKIGGYFLDSAFQAMVTGQREPADSNSSPVVSAPPDNINGSYTSNEIPASQSNPHEPAGAEPASDTTPIESSSEPAKPTVQYPPTEAPSDAAPVQEEPKNQTAEYTQEQISNITDSISASDKLSASLLVMSKLSSEDISYLYALLEDGLTPEEKAAAKELCFLRFTDEEIAQLYDLYIKYAQ